MAPLALLEAPREAEDVRLADRIAGALRETGYASLREVKLTVRSRVVRLSGSVPSYHLKQVATTTALAVEGVGQIDNDLEVCSST
jgi:osmotically-inducible protein OsmY